MSDTTPSDEPAARAAFAAEVAKAGLTVAADEMQTLFEGYLGLQTLLGALPRDIPLGDEPAMIAVAGKARVIR